MDKIILLSLAVLSVAANAVFGASCEKNYDMLGCYEESNPTNLLMNDRRNINWGDIVGYMEGLACKCAKKAKEGEYAGFALHYWGECYGKTAAQLEALTTKGHQEHRCVGDQTYTKCDMESHAHCTGMDYAEGVFKFKAAAPKNTDGGFGKWAPWTTCDKECGTGMKHRERNCDNPAPVGSGKDCSELGAYSESLECKIKECPVDGGYSAWTSYGACNKACGAGQKTRTRTCTNPAPLHDGKDCSRLGSASENAACTGTTCPVNGNWGSYGSFASCSKKCGTGTQTRTRSCNNPAPKNSGAPCSGSSTNTQNCNTEGCPDIISCQTKYTSYATHDGGNMVYLDRHRMNCGGKGHILSYFHLQRSGSNMRYQYKCCQLKDTSTCSIQSKTTPFSSDGDGKLSHMDRHTADCGTTGFINDFKIERNSGHDKIRFKYYCCNLIDQRWKNAASCYSKYTSFTDDGNDKVYYLDRQTVSCNSGYALSYFKMQRNSSHNKVRYYYKCCKVSY